MIFYRQAMVLAVSDDNDDDDDDDAERGTFSISTRQL